MEGRKALCGWVVVLEGGNRGKDFKLYEGKNVIGSSPQASVFLPEEGVDPFHASIRCEGGRAYITDLDSEGGTYLGEERVWREELKDGAKIKIGSVLLAVKLI